MKKTVLIILSAIILLFLCACSGNTTDQTTTAETTAAPSETIEFTVEIDPNEKSLNDADFPFDEYVKLADISSIKVPTSEKKEVTDEYVSKWITSCLTNLGHFTRDDSKTVVSNGDVVSIDFESTINGEEYSGGIQSDFCFLMDADAFVPDLENALLGKNVGDTFDISVTYPDDYTVETLAGKTADFTVTVNYLGTPDSLNEENVKDLSNDKYCPSLFSAPIRRIRTIEAFRRHCLSKQIYQQELGICNIPGESNRTPRQDLKYVQFQLRSRI